MGFLTQNMLRKKKVKVNRQMVFEDFFLSNSSQTSTSIHEMHYVVNKENVINSNCILKAEMNYYVILNLGCSDVF